MDRHERLDYAERWVSDGFRVFQRNAAGFAVQLEVDMTGARALIERLRETGLRATYTGLLLWAAGQALSRCPELHQLVVGTRRLRPGRVDIGLSVANEAAAAPLLLVEDVARKSLAQISDELERRVPEVRAQDTKNLRNLRRWGWLVPGGWLRRLVLRLFLSSLWARRRLAGTLQVSVLPNVDVLQPFLFSPPAVLALGRVAERVVAVAGRPAVRLTATLAACADHKIVDGRRLGSFVAEVARLLQGEELPAEAPGQLP